MKITRVKLTKEKLAKLRDRDRTLFLWLGNVTNELSILQKLMLMTRKGAPPSKMIDIVEAGQTMFFPRLLVGKVHEARLLLEKRVNKDADFKKRYGLNEQSASSGSELSSSPPIPQKTMAVQDRLSASLEQVHRDFDGD